VIPNEDLRPPSLPPVQQGHMKAVVDEVRGLSEEVARLKQKPPAVKISQRTARDAVEEGQKELSRTSNGFVTPDPNA